ncbi:Werner Syndrome-like exonuclease [Dioscorea cayenensis subsp. rotundata]|uniref:3'-5' exonuclease n=1 Tax=Dioscorea cayennensis subsp. rotundata TaxID=55577 RepID=A0AB40C6N0_DIOCR|nr:Werner Syndrome-like exonuclease [Dioscorea cayenensis subsp. rotundata]
MGSEGSEAAANPMPEWDLAAEKELVAAEKSYLAKRKKRFQIDPASASGSPSHCPKARRLPAWTSLSPAHRSGDHNALAPTHAIPNSRNGVWNLAPHVRPVNLKVRHQSFNFGGHIVYSRTVPEVEQSARELLQKIKGMEKNMEPVSLGFDIEWKPAFGRGETQNKAAVMQICMDSTHCYVMHIIHTGIPPILKSLLEDTFIYQGVCVANDATKIWRDYNVRVECLQDLSVLANLKLGGAPRNWSLSSLTETLTCKELEKPKKIRLGNWQTNILSQAQLQYAATDAYVSWYLYQVLRSFSNTKAETNSSENMNNAES